MARVAELLETWARARGADRSELLRWRAAAFLHDVLREAEPSYLRSLVPEGLRDLPDPVLHGPAAAARLEREGVRDPALLHAVAFHTIGHPKLDRLGRALYAADFLDAGRDCNGEWAAGLRDRMPEDPDEVVTAVARARIERLLERGSLLRSETVAFWNSLVGGGGG